MSDCRDLFTTEKDIIIDLKIDEGGPYWEGRFKNRLMPEVRIVLPSPDPRHKRSYALHEIGARVPAQDIVPIIHGSLMLSRERGLPHQRVKGWLTDGNSQSAWHQEAQSVGF